jgi:hypothetical protein
MSAITSSTEIVLCAVYAAGGGGGMMSGIGSTIVQGMAFGTGSAIAHRCVRDHLYALLAFCSGCVGLSDACMCLSVCVCVSD